MSRLNSWPFPKSTEQTRQYYVRKKVRRNKMKLRGRYKHGRVGVRHAI